MEKTSSSSDASRELQCVGRLEIVRPNSIPIPTDSALVQELRVPRYQNIPPDTDIEAPEDTTSEIINKSSLDENISSQINLEFDNMNIEASETSSDQISISAEKLTTAPITVDPFAFEYAAIHNASQAIKSLRWLQSSTETELGCNAKYQEDTASSVEVSVCACGDTDCIEVCDIREWLPASKLDEKLWRLVLLLGERYLDLGQAYKDYGQLQPALRVAELSCLVYWSMPQHLNDTRFISSMVCRSTERKSRMDDEYFTPEYLSSTYCFWGKAWTLVGDVYAKLLMVKGKDDTIQTEKNPFSRELKMSSDVLKEVKRLNKKLGPLEKCSSCFLVNCSCKRDRASSGSSASSSRRDSQKQSRKSTAKSFSFVRSEKSVADRDHHKGDKPEHAYDMSAIDSFKSVPEFHDAEPTIPETVTRKTKLNDGGIFRYIKGPLTADDEYNLTASLSCYEEAIEAFGGDPAHSTELQSVVTKKGWVYNELGRKMLERNDRQGAELAFVEAVKSFKVVSDHANIILINCNMGHGRRTLAEDVATKLMLRRVHSTAYIVAVDTAKQQYAESLRYYEAAKVELKSLLEEDGSVSSSFRNEVYTQLANTYLRLGMLLASEDTSAKIYGNGLSEESIGPGTRNANNELRKREISASDAMKEAINLFEALGELRKQEAAFSYFQLAIMNRNRCLKMLAADKKNSKISKGETSVVQKVKQYASLAEKNWKKAKDFYGPITYPMMYLTIIIDMSDLSLNMWDASPSNSMLDSALTTLLEGRHVSEDKIPDSLQTDISVYSRFWQQLQSVLKKLLSVSKNTKRPLAKSEQSNSKRTGAEEKLKQLYRISLTPTDFSQLHEIYRLWTS